MATRSSLAGIRSFIVRAFLNSPKTRAIAVLFEAPSGQDGCPYTEPRQCRRRGVAPVWHQGMASGPGVRVGHQGFGITWPASSAATGCRDRSDDPAGQNHRMSSSSSAAINPAITSSAMTPNAPCCRSAQPTGPSFVMSNSRNSTKAATQARNVGRASASMVIHWPANSSITTQPGSPSIAARLTAR